jgi:hypothetical protein
MKKINKKIIITALSLVLLLTASVGLTAAYFTDYEAAKGGASLSLSGQTQLEETMSGNDKTIVISNVGETDMIVRVQVIGDLKKLNVSGGGWNKGADGWFYWHEVLKGSKTEAERGETSILKVSVNGTVGETDFDIIVVHEASRTVYDGDKLAVPNGWDADAVGKIALQ